MDAQGELFASGFDFVALQIQSARRYAKIEAYLTASRKQYLYGEASIIAIGLDRDEQYVFQLPHYQRSVLVSPLYIPEALERADPAWQTKWLAKRKKRERPRRGDDSS